MPVVEQSGPQPYTCVLCFFMQMSLIPLVVPESLRRLHTDVHELTRTRTFAYVYA